MSTKLKACGHSDCVVIHAQPQCRNEGRTLSHAPDSLAVKASKRARALALGAVTYYNYIFQE